MHYKVSCSNINKNKLPVTGSKRIDVFFGSSDKLTDRIPFFFSLLSENEKERANRFKFEPDYNNYVSVHAMLRIELAKLIKTDPASVTISATQKGKPYISGADLPFSISRSGNLFAFVIGYTNQSVGIDIEGFRPSIDFTEISRNYFSKEENQLIFSFENTEDQNRTFYEIWTRKEALLKAIGIGIITELTGVSVVEGINNVTITDADTTEDAFNISTISFGKTVISIASSPGFVPRFTDLSK